MSFPQLRNQLLGLQNQLSGKLSQYSSFTTAPGSNPSDDELSTCRSIEQLIGKISENVGGLDRIVNSNSSISTSKLQQLARHKEALNQFRIDYNRIQSTIKEERDRLNLLSNVRNEIQDGNSRQGPENSEAYLMDERMRVDRQHGVMDNLLNQVFETRDDILRQRGSLRNVGSRLQKSLATMPGINILMNQINTRRKRNTFIIAAVIVLCTIALWFLS
ncbi:hypothetical protein FOA43_002759 [Brettanomyces nanus]|uniref:Golgi SNAP receptor complex member 1 n=1 Tax=Eeniella nana TaxID=13502 RepID=A0A875S4W7_EENNA|nr:uncharacterized protein FOA43_002759 [Brettanomyces nanus]QPG75405.1 hypothetical protein FOA43_002759 [Brettanomyces nanus]